MQCGYFVVAVLDSEKTFEYYYYVLKHCKNTVMYQKLLVTFILSAVTTFIEDLFNRYSIKLWVTTGSIKLTNICMYLHVLFILLIVELT